MAYVFILAGLTVLGAILSLWSAFAASTIWQWYLVPEGLPSLPVWAVFGGLLVYNTLKGVRYRKKDERPPVDQLSDYGGHLLACAVAPVMFLAAAWLGTFFA